MPRSDLTAQGSSIAVLQNGQDLAGANVTEIDSRVRVLNEHIILRIPPPFPEHILMMGFHCLCHRILLLESAGLSRLSAVSQCATALLAGSSTHRRAANTRGFDSEGLIAVALAGFVGQAGLEPARALARAALPDYATVPYMCPAELHRTNEYQRTTIRYRGAASYGLRLMNWKGGAIPG